MWRFSNLYLKKKQKKLFIGILKKIAIFLFNIKYSGAAEVFTFLTVNQSKAMFNADKRGNNKEL